MRRSITHERCVTLRCESSLNAAKQTSTKKVSLKVTSQVIRPPALTGLYREIIVSASFFSDFRNTPQFCHIRRLDLKKKEKRPNLPECSLSCVRSAADLSLSYFYVLTTQPQAAVYVRRLGAVHGAEPGYHGGGGGGQGGEVEEGEEKLRGRSCKATFGFCHES